MSGFRIMSIGNCEPQEESDNDRLSGELVPIISRDQFEGEAEKFLTRYCPEALDKPMRVPIETIASDMKLQVIEDVPLSDDLTYFGTIIFDNGNVLDKHRKITIRNAKRGTVYLDPRVSYERSVGTKRTTLAHECFHWYRHQPYHVLMKMIGADDNLGKAIQCQIAANSIDSDKWKAVDWMEWQAKGVAPRILMPARPTRLKADQLLAVYGGADDASIAAYENVIDELAELFDVSRQAAKVRLMDLGCSKAEGAYPFVDGQYVRGYSFEAGALDKNQTFTIPYADLFKAYCFDREFKKLIDSGQFIFADRHLVLDNEKYIARDQSGNATLSEYALSHMGYGTVAYGSHATVASGDDGIDGVIMEDKLGFSLIYMQAKEWAPDRVVGQPDIQSFVGAIAGKHGDGLFVTTAKFSQKAKDYANTHHIILIDGERLANLMIEYNFCVSTRKTFEIKAIDTDALAEYQDE